MRINWASVAATIGVSVLFVVFIVHVFYAAS